MIRGNKKLETRQNSATQKDVATLAGVSVATVSRVLNNVNSVDAQIRTKVEKAIYELRYTPNEIARSLRVRATNTIGMVAPEIANPFAMEVASGAQRVFHDLGYVTMVSGSESKLSNERSNLNMLVDKRVDGLLVTPVSSNPQELERINKWVPIVLIDYVNTNRFDSVRVDNVEGAFHAVSHLVTRGYRHIATIAGPQKYTSDRERLEGFFRAMEHHNLDVPSRYVRHGDFFIEGGYRQCRNLLDDCPEIEAVFAANNLMGIGAFKAIRDSGREIPRDVALCIFDDFLMADMAAPPLTVIAQPTFAIGETAARMLVERITKAFTGGARQVLLKPKLIVREST